ncbi:hypothetical protein EVAR_54893_1 [Eumeta japonica]|uniref:Uncharacterized protein n=1 Tax=Eumeta variegata TaxID=151549 RepID=A0A4C2A0S7_EUMVA|nr:hypothetical protein EVAR_54893_1 [Eumeta japonica]
MSQRRGAGSDPHWPRGKRRARKAAALAHSAVYERGPPQSVRLQPPTRKHSLLRVLKRSSGPPSARPSHSAKVFEIACTQCNTYRPTKAFGFSVKLQSLEILPPNPLLDFGVTQDTRVLPNTGHTVTYPFDFRRLRGKEGDYACAATPIQPMPPRGELLN